MTGFEAARYGGGYLFPQQYPVSNVSAEDEALINDRQSFVSSTTTHSHRPGDNNHHPPPQGPWVHHSPPEYKSKHFAAGPRPKYWNTIWLTKTTIGSFVASGLLTTAALIALYIVSTRDFGLVSQDARYRYTWTYGPTAVLVLLASLWMRVDHWSKTLVPYERMRKATTPASQSILQDYLSPFNAFALASSIRNRDFAVTFAIAGSILLQIAIVISTSIILLESRQLPLSLSLPVTRSFVTSAPNVSVGAVDGTPAVRYYGIANGTIAYPATISNEMVIENFHQNTTSSSNLTYSAKVAGMSARLDCQPLDLKNNSYRVSMPWRSILAPGFAIDINTTDCFIRGVPIGIGADHNPPIHLLTTTTFQGWWANFTCNDNFTNYVGPPFTSDPRLMRPSNPAFNDKRMVFTTSTVQWTADDSLNGTGPRRVTWVQNFTGIICKPSYSIDDYMVTYSPQQNSTQEPFTAVKQSGTSRKIPNFDDTALSPLLNAALSKSRLFNMAPRPDGAPAMLEEDAGYIRPEDKFFMILNQLNGISRTSAFLNQSTLLEFVPKAFSGVMAQVFERHFTTPVNKQTAAQAVLSENRLVLKTVPTALMIALLVLITSCFIALFIMRPRNVVPLDPQTLSAQAKLVASSSNLARDLQPFTGLAASRMPEEVGKYDFRTDVHPTEYGSSFVINRCVPINMRESVPAKSPAAHHVWWRPVTSKFFFTAMLLLSTLGIVAALEVLQRISDSEDGILNFQEWGSKHTLITSVPAAVMALIALSFAALNFNVALMAPFAALKHRPRAHQHGLDVALLGKPSVLALYGATKHFMKLPIFSMVAVIVGSFLTIVVSGLYYVESVPVNTPITLQQVDQFNYTSALLRKGDNAAAVVTKLIWFENATYPPGTYNNLVFPKVALTGTHDDILNTSHVKIQIPAIRPKLNCITISSDNISYDTRFRGDTLSPGDSNYGMNISAWVEMPCYEKIDGSGKIVNCKYPWSIVLYFKEGEKDEVVGAAVSSDAYASIQCLAYKPGNATYVGDLKNRALFPLANGCPSLHFAYGTVTTRASLNKTTTQDRPKVIGGVCFQNLEEVQTKVSLNLPQLTISANNPPTVLEDTVKLVNVTSGNYTGPNYFNSLETLLWTLYPNNVDTSFGPFYQALLEGRTHFKPGDLSGLANLPRLLSAQNELYGVYMAQAINSNFRYNGTQSSTSSQSATTPAAQPQYPGTMSNTTRQRLKQQPQLKIALQVMLAVMAACALIVFIFSDRKPILPHNPCTIAGTTILFAGSEMATRKLVPAGAEWSNSNQIWEGWFFSLGWWGTQENPRYEIDVGKAEKSIEDLPKGLHAPRASDGGGGGGQWMSNPHPPSNGTGYDYSTKKHGSVDVYEMNMFERSNSRVSVDVGDMGQQQTAYDHVYPQGQGFQGYVGYVNNGFNGYTGDVNQGRHFTS